MNGYLELKTLFVVQDVIKEVGIKMQLSERQFLEGTILYRDMVILDVVRKYGYHSAFQFYDKLEYYHPNLKDMFLEIIDDLINYMIRAKDTYEIKDAKQIILTRYTKVKKE